MGPGCRHTLLEVTQKGTLADVTTPQREVNVGGGQPTCPCPDQGPATSWELAGGPAGLHRGSKHKWAVLALKPHEINGIFLSSDF